MRALRQTCKLPRAAARLTVRSNLTGAQYAIQNPGSLQLRLDGNQDHIGHSLHPRPILPPLQGVGRRQLEIPLEDLDHLLSECHTINIQTGLVVKLVRTHVEVGGSDRHHVSIEDQHIAVKHGGFIFVDLHTAREKRVPYSRRSDAHRFGIVCLSGKRMRICTPRARALMSSPLMSVSGTK
jgi:hypothetical protein